jgi:hypothetical protein
LSSGAISAQEIRMDDDGLHHDYSYFCPAYIFSYEGKTNPKLDILEANNISLAGADCLIAIEKAKEYIVKNRGAEFLNHVDFERINITYLDSADAFTNLDFYLKKVPRYDLSKCKAKYFVNFMFHSDKTEFYRFGVAMNEEFEILSPLLLPDNKTNPDFYKVIEPQEAYKIALKKHKKLIKNAKSIHFYYEEELNAFVWDITGQREEEKPKSKTQTRIDINYGFVRINAVTGEILYAARDKGYVMICPRYF